MPDVHDRCRCLFKTLGSSAVPKVKLPGLLTTDADQLLHTVVVLSQTPSQLWHLRVHRSSYHPSVCCNKSLNFLGEKTPPKQQKPKNKGGIHKPRKSNYSTICLMRWRRLAPSMPLTHITESFLFVFLGRHRLKDFQQIRSVRSSWISIFPTSSRAKAGGGGVAGWRGGARGLCPCGRF